MEEIVADKKDPYPAMNRGAMRWETGEMSGFLKL